MGVIEDRSGVNGAWEYYHWCIAGPQGNPEQGLNDLLSAMTRYATAVVWQQMKQRRMDIVNDCLLRAVRGLPGFREDSRFSTWFHSIVVNRCKTVRREERERREVPLEAVPVVEQACTTLLDLIEDEQVKDFVYRKCVQGYNDYELGARYNLSPSGVRSRWRRIKEKLRRMM